MDSNYNDWKHGVFSEFVNINPSRHIRKNQIVKFVSMEAVEPRHKYVKSIEMRAFSGGSKFCNNDTLFARITPSLEHGKTCFVNFLEDNELGAGSTEFIVFSEKEGMSYSEFIYYLSCSDEIREPTIKSMTGTSGRQRVDTNVFEHIPVKMPPLKEQKAISRILSDLDSKIELNHQMNKTLESIAQAIFKHWFIDFEFPDENGQPYKSSGGEMVDSELGEIPKGWKTSRLGECVEISGGSTPKTSESNFWNDGKFHWATPKDLSDLTSSVLTDTLRKITESGLKSIGNKLYPKGSLLLSSRAPIGYLAITDIDTSVNQGIIVIPPRGDLSPPYLFSWCREKMSDIQNMANGSTFLEISKGNFRSMGVILPAEKTLSQYDSLVFSIFNRMILNSRQSVSLQSIRNELLPKLMSGKIRVPLEE